MTETIEQVKKEHYTLKKIQNNDDKSDKTKAEYLKEAEGFLRRELDKKGIERTPANICKALKEWSATVQANTYRKRQCALEYHQHCNKFYKSAEKIRNTQRLNYGDTGNGQKRPHCKTVTESQHIKLLLESNKKSDRQVSASLSIAYFVGLRPCEQNHIQYADKDGELLLFVRSAKKNKDGTRSIDKVIKVELDDGDRQRLINDIDCLYGLTDKQIVNIRNRVCRLSKKCFPKLKKPPTLYSYRHQLGSDLKGSNITDRQEAAAVLGHKSQNSLCAYGHANGAGGLKRSLPKATESTVRKVNDDLKQTDFLEKLNSENEVSSDAVNAGHEQEVSPVEQLAQETVSESAPVTKLENNETAQSDKPSLANYILQRMKPDDSTQAESKTVGQNDKAIKTSRHTPEDDTDYK